VGLSILVFYGDDAVQDAYLFDAQETSGDELALAEVVEHRDFVANLGDTDQLAGHRFAQGEGVIRRKAAVRGRDGVTVGVVVGMAKELGQALREPVRDGVLQTLGLLVYLLPGVTKVLEQEGLDQTVPPH
jgi:hypothetical protein